jgi:hypothetical protein
VPRRGLRDHPLGKVLLLAAVLGIAVVATRTCASQDREIDAEEAVELARAEASFEPCTEPACEQRRLVPRGIPPRQYWAVVLAPALDASGVPTRTESFLVDATTGEVRRVG